MLRVVLFDPILDGHHFEYASYVGRYLSDVGDQVTLVTWSAAEPSAGPSVSDSPFPVRSVNKQGSRLAQNPALRLVQYIQGFRYCESLAREQEADIVHHLYIDRAELPLLMATLHLHSTDPWNLFGTLFWPYFLHEPGETVPLPKRLYHQASHAALRRLLQRKHLKGLFVHSDRIRKRLLASYKDDSLASQIVLVPDPSPTPIAHSQQTARDRLVLPPENPIFLFFGGLRWDKGPDILLQALPLLQGNWTVVLAGRPDLIGQTEIEACRRRLSDPGKLVTRLGFVPELDTDSYFQAADAVVLPYRRMFGGTSGVLQRAAAAGTPVIVTDVGDIGPTVREQGLGIVVEPEAPAALAEAMRQFLKTRVELTKYVQPRALAYAEASSWRQLGERVRAAYSASLSKAE